MTQNVKQLSLLTSPLNKIQEATEVTAIILNKIAEVIINGANSKTTNETADELKKQTAVLLDIKSLLKEQANSSGGGGNTKLPGIMGAAKTGLAIVIMAGALVAASGILGYMQPVTAVQMLTALAIGALFMILVPVFIKISDQFKGPGLTDRIIGKVTNVGNGETPSMNKLLAGVGLAMVIMAAGTAASSYILSLVKPITGAQFMTAALIGIAFIFLSVSFGIITRTLTKSGLTPDKKGYMTLGMVALSMIAIAMGTVGVAYAFMLMPKNPQAPDLGWTLRAGLAIGLFAIGFNFILKAIKGASLKDIIFASLAIPGIAIAIAGVAYAFMLMPTDPIAPDFGWTLRAALAIGLFAIGFNFIMKAIKGASLMDIIFSSIAIPLMAVAIVGTAYIFGLLGDVSNWVAPDALWTLKAGFAILVFSIPFYFVAKAVKGLGLKELLFMAVAIPIIAFGVMATAYIFQGLSGIENVAPQTDWSVSAGIALVIFSGVLYLVGLTMGKNGVKETLKGLLDLVVVSFAILATAWLFSMLPTNFNAPTMDWTLSAALAIGAFGIVIAAVGLAVQALTPAALLLGALGIIVIAITIVAVGWILSLLEPAMPALKAVASGFVDIVMMPINAIITAFGRFKNEIGIENMIPLAIGVAALGGAWLIFSAAVAGGDVAGLLGSAAGAVGAIFNGISSLFGGSTPSPLDILKELAVLGPQIQTLAAPLTAVGTGFALINRSAAGVSKAFESVVNFVEDTDVDDLKENAKSLNSIANSYTKISNASRTLNVKAIETTTNMFKALTDLAKNNGQSAMGILADKLLVAVKELTGAAKNLEDSVSKQGDATSGIGDAVSGALNTVKETVTNVKKDVSKMTADAKGVMDLQPLIDAITSLEERFDTFITVKIKPE